ncbi:MAG: hypothetical protein LBT26_12415 [Clostridiales Family XIII bacterium]|jgi:hypothetical protein|nr:hypothetical protein [Clostridiales Family XIII bacterium]
MRRFVGIFLSATLIFAGSFAGAGGAVFAADTESKGLEAAIVTVKNIVDIPDSLTRFNFDYYGEDGKTTYSMNWSNEDAAKNFSIYAEVRGDYLVSYNCYTEDGPQGLGSVSRASALETAADFLKKVNAGLAAKMQPVENAAGRDTYTHYFDFVLEENGLRADFISAAVSVNKHTGEVVSYSWYSVDETPVFPAATGLIPEERAKESYLDGDGIRLEYRSYFDYAGQKFTVFPVYVAANANFAVDARTGETVLLNDGYPVPTDGGMAGGMGYNSMEAEASKQPSPAELSAVDKAAGLLTGDEAQRALTKAFPELSGMKPTRSSLVNDYQDKEVYRWNLEFEKSNGNISGAVNAKTGEILSWYNYEDKQDAGDRITPEAARKTTQDFLEANAAKRYPLTVLDEDSAKANDISYRSTAVYGYETYQFRFDRQVDGYAFRTDNLSISINQWTGKIVAYTCNWHENAVFPPVNDTLQPAGAFDIFDEKSDFTLKYAKILKESGSEIIPVYTWAQTPAYMVDPADGTLTGQDGKPYRVPVYASYDDISGHWAEDTVNALLDNGYYLEGSHFEPKNAIGQEKFLRFLYAPEQTYYDQDALYRMLDSMGIVKEGERDPAALLSRYDAAKFITRYLGQQKIGAHPEAFVDLYKDAVAEEYKGYAAVVKVLSIMQGDAAGNFNGDKSLSNAEAAVVIFNALQAAQR